MAIEHTISAATREKTGTAECRRLRKAGMVPANLYGKGKDSLSIQVSRKDLNSLIATGSRLFGLEHDGQNETAMFQQVQWDAFGIELQHVDFLRVNADERVTIEVPLDIRGTAPGIAAGGIFEQPLRSLQLECLASAIPGSVAVRVGELKMGESIYVRDLQLPDGVECMNQESALVCQVSVPRGLKDDGDGDDALAEPGPVEPELIGKKSSDDDEDAS